MENLNEYLGGRIFNTAELDVTQIRLLNEIGSKQVDAIKNNICQRCLMPVINNSRLTYCRNCINLGRISGGNKLIISPAEALFNRQSTPMNWSGELTVMQKKASEELITAYNTGTDHLVWAVTGAGKTEMIYPMIERVILDGKRIAICSPRVDVCIELFPRVQAAFPQTSIGLFHGRSEERYSFTQIMLSTVHQLIKFEGAFDVLVIDEVDSYPLAGNKMLEQAIYKAKKSTGNLIFLSATPPRELLEDVKNQKVTISKLYQRFHTYPLPEPKCHMLFKSSDFCKINPRLKYRIQKMIDTGQRFMLFFPKIPAMLSFANNLKNIFPELTFVDVSSKDEQRLEKVQKFRDKNVQAILTTTILERGVTFKKITVMVIDADAKEFSKTSLIQIAGRAGRASESHDDEVHFYYQSYNRQIKQACAEINYLNRQAKK
ncbi:DEAD/DEAH box helicase [Companilactobacillus hulinensis]|uniref:DEAD/DEAH box helicase n=1 Tax=Companilactobacillus hulinensis TaxID=2486007 RepID=UPI000F78D876|nr:DEAD/DEAH box helicase [Companilactobacillus hulinensis]